MILITNYHDQSKYSNSLTIKGTSGVLWTCM